MTMMPFGFQNVAKAPNYMWICFWMVVIATRRTTHNVDLNFKKWNVL